MSRSLKLSIVLLCLLPYQFALALDEDKQEPLHIKADTTVFNFKTGVKIYEGNVRVDQGSSHIRSDRLITKDNNEHKIEEVVAYGINSTAHYWTLLKKEDPEMHAYANIIKFYPASSDIVLEKNVYVYQGENNFKGDIVLYSNDNQTITVPASANGQAMLVYHPEDKNEDKKKKEMQQSKLKRQQQLAKAKQRKMMQANRNNNQQPLKAKS